MLEEGERRLRDTLRRRSTAVSSSSKRRGTAHSSKSKGPAMDEMNVDVEG
jgi:hypothetical protein